MKDLQPWGCQVRVHDGGEDKSKLEGRSKIGRWMGFDPETKDGHRVFWPEKRSVSVERSVRFKFNDEMVVRVLPIEGETDTMKEPTSTMYRDSDVAKDPEPEASEGRGKRIRKESDYIRMLREGSGTTGLKSTLPKGMQSGSMLNSS